MIQLTALAAAVTAALSVIPRESAMAGAAEALESWKKGDFAGVLAACQDAAKAGDMGCQVFLGVLYDEGKGVKQNPTEAFRWFHLAADQGSGAAAFNLGNDYESGHGTAKDMDAALKWYRLAAEKGVPDAQLRLGIYILDREKDWKEALKLIRPAAAQGLPMAQSILGFAYESGSGVRRNEKTAARWYEHAAEHGATPAQMGIAGLYERGEGVETDLAEAYFWYAVALRDPKNKEKSEAQAALKRIAPKLTKEELAEETDAAREFEPKEVEIGPPARKSRRKSAKSRGGDESGLFATGSGFYVTPTGYLLTNNHVVAQCREVRVSEGEKGIPLKLIAVDADRDLALLQAPRAADISAVFRADEKLRPGENVVVVGYPLQGLLTDPIVTTGIVSALAGPRNDRRQLQISAPIQPGNSGGPLLDASGHIIGVVVATLSTVRVAQLTGAIPENINFAVKGDEARDFLAAHDVKVATAPQGKEISTAAIADRALGMTVKLECWK